MAEETAPLDPDTLDVLIDRLNCYPVGLPDAPELREFLSIFLTPDEAKLASLFPLIEATAAELAKRAGWEEGRTRKTLGGMAQKGTVVDFVLGGSRYWLLAPSVVGFVEFSLMKLHDGMPMRRLAELLDRYSEEHLWKEVFGSNTAPMRALVGEGVPVSSRIATYAEVETVVRSFGKGAVQNCYCRSKEELLGKPCKLASSQGTCFSLGVAADFVVRRGFGQAMGADGILARIRELGAQGLIHVTDNVRDRPSFVCNCCGCCCGLLNAIRRKGSMRAVSPTPYILAIDEDRCSGCGACAKRCQIQAVVQAGGKARLVESRCLGCGSCVKFCRRKALSLRPRNRRPALPRNAVTKFARIAWDKGRLWPLLKAGLRTRLRGA